MEETLKKINKCKYCMPKILSNNGIEHLCRQNGDEKVVTETECEKCDKFDSRYIEYPIEVNSIETNKIETDGLFHEVGCLVEICPCEEKYEGKSYIGIYIGELPISITVSYNKKEKKLKAGTLNNPAIFVPDLKKIIYGCESYWRVIKNINDFKGITKEDIESQWYVKLMKGLMNDDKKDKSSV